MEEESMVDVSRLTDAAQPIVRQVSAVYLRHTAPWFLGLIVHGSAFKGGIIPGCSDVDFQLYLDRAAFDRQGQLPLELGFAIRRDLEGIRLAPFRYVQCYAHSQELPAGWTGPIPGAYHLVAGRLPVPEATAGNLYTSAQKELAALDTTPDFLMGKLLGPGGVRLERSIRLLCTKVWPVLYQVLTLRAAKQDILGIWRLPKEQAMDCLVPGTELHDTIRRFYQSLWDYYPAEDSLDDALAVIGRGIAFMQAAGAWWAQAGPGL